MTALEQFKEFIAQSRLRMTREREAVVLSIYDQPSHFTVSMIAGHLRAKGLTIAPSTIYRMIPYLMAAGLIRKAPGEASEEEQRYEPMAGREHHDHLICDSCGAMIEFEDEKIEARQKYVAEKYGYRLKKHQLVLVGVCPSCQEKIIERAVNAW